VVVVVIISHLSVTSSGVDELGNKIDDLGKGLNKTNVAGVEFVKTLDELSDASANLTEQNMRQAVSANALAEADAKQAASRKKLLDDQDALLAKVNELIRVYGLNREEIMHLNATEAGMSDVVHQRINDLQLLVAATKEYGKVITDI